MKNKNIILTTFSLILIAIISCNGNINTVPDGGEPCNYEDKIFPATLIKIIDMNVDEYDAQFKLEGNHDLAGKDTIYYSNLNNRHYISKKDKPVDSLVIGKQYSYTVKKILSGCIIICYINNCSSIHRV